MYLIVLIITLSDLLKKQLYNYMPTKVETININNDKTSKVDLCSLIICQFLNDRSYMLNIRNIVVQSSALCKL